MAVPEQTPYKEYDGNGVTKTFTLEFICESKDHLKVTINGVEPELSAWSFNANTNSVTFSAAPAADSKIVLQRETPMSRTTNYQSTNNSMTPKALNGDIDRVWLKLQELGVADMLLKIYVDRLHGEQKDYIDNKDQLVRNIITDLRNYVNQQDGSLSSDINNLRTHVNQQDNSLAQSITNLRNDTNQLHNNQKNYIDQQDNNRNSYFENLISRQGVALDQLDDYYNYLMQRLAQIAVDKGWDASFIVSADGSTQQEINDFGGAKWWPKPLGYKLGATVKLENGDIVKNTVENNIVDPNIDMTGWSNQSKRTLNLDEFKTGANTDADAFTAMLDYAKASGVKSLNITRDITLNRKIAVTQDATLWLNSININFNEHKINWTGAGADNLSFGIFEIKGSLTSTITTATVDYAEYTSELTVENASGFAVGDWILIDSVSTTLPDIYLNILVKIEAISGNVIQTDTVRRLAVRPSVAAVNITKVNVVDGFRITGHPLATATNQTSRANGISFVQYQYAVNSHAYVRSEKLWFKNFRSSQCSRLTVIAHGEKPAATGGGEGYVVQLEYTSHSVVKATADKMRHCVDLTMAWHNNIVDSYDFESASAPYVCHAAYEYNNHFWRCVSVRSVQYGFQFGVVTGLFGDTTDQNYLHDCQVLDSTLQCVNFANKGKGLYIYGGVYDGKSYALLISNNDTFIYNSRLLGGIQVTTSTALYTGGQCEIHNSETTFKPGTRSINLAEGRSIKFVGGSVTGLISAAADSSIETLNTTVTCPSNTNLIGNINTVSLKMKGGKFIIPAGATADQTNILKSIEMDGVEFVQTDSSRGNNLLGLKTVIKNCTGSGRFSFDGSSVKDLNLSRNDLNAVGSAALITLLNMTTKTKINSNTLASSGNTLVIGATNVIPVLQMIGNDITGVTSIPDAQVISGIVQGNMFAGVTTLPTNNGTDKIIGGNIINT